jgi:flagellar protein FlaI
VPAGTHTLTAKMMGFKTTTVRNVVAAMDLRTTINITMEPITLHGPTITVRKQKKHLLSITELLQNGTLDLDLAALLWLSVDGMRMCPANMVIAGMIGSGKTTLLNALAMLAPPDDRVITIEDTPELQLSGKANWVPMVSDKEYDMELLVRNTLRMRPNRIIVGEIRGSEAMALFNAMNVGHKGMGTLHASSSRESIYRLENPPMNVPMSVIANLDLIVIMNIFNYKGRPVRRVTEVAEVGGHEGDTILLGSIYQWDPVKDRAVGGDKVAPTTYIDKLADKIKVSKREVLTELSKRKAVLIDLVNRGV